MSNSSGTRPLGRLWDADGGRGVIDVEGAPSAGAVERGLRRER